MNHRKLIYKEENMAYYRWGTGARAVFAFHGYGESGLHFVHLAKEIPATWSLLAIDLPFHGNTSWSGVQHFSAEELHQIIQRILEIEQLTVPVQLLGYSMGGRISLDLYQHFPEAYTALTLVAPDGLSMNFWYWLSTQTAVGNRLFRFTMGNPHWFKILARIGVKLGLVNPGAHKFIERYMNDPAVRNELYIRWTAMRHFRPNISLLKKLISRYHTPLRLLYGQYDRIITSSAGENFRKGIAYYVHLKILPGGHQLLQPTFVKEIIGEMM